MQVGRRGSKRLRCFQGLPEPGRRHPEGSEEPAGGVERVGTPEAADGGGVTHDPRAAHAGESRCRSVMTAGSGHVVRGRG